MSTEDASIYKHIFDLFRANLKSETTIASELLEDVQNMGLMDDCQAIMSKLRSTTKTAGSDITDACSFAKQTQKYGINCSMFSNTNRSTEENLRIYLNQLTNKTLKTILDNLNKVQATLRNIQASLGTQFNQKYQEKNFNIMTLTESIASLGSKIEYSSNLTKKSQIKLNKTASKDNSTEEVQEQLNQKNKQLQTFKETTNQSICSMQKEIIQLQQQLSNCQTQNQKLIQLNQEMSKNQADLQSSLKVQTKQQIVIPKQLELTSSVKFCYWDYRGFGQTQRLLLAFSGVIFEDIYFPSESQQYKSDNLYQHLDFPNLPFLIDGDYNITQPAAIERYIINRWGNSSLLGKTITDNARVESFLSVFTEVATAFKRLYFCQNYQSDKIAVLQKYRVKLNELDKFVGNNKFVIGYLTLADFVVAQQSHFIQALFPSEYLLWPFLQNIRQAFDRIPQIINYYQNPNAFKGDFYGKSSLIKIRNDY